MIRWLSLSLMLAAGARADDALLTVAERSGYKATARHEEVMDLCRALDGRSDAVRLAELGRSTEGRPIPLLIVSDPPVASAAEARASGKVVVLLVGNIHAGEVCGKEALPMLVREVALEAGHPWMKDLILAVVPNFNPDGNERVSEGNRPGQVGPEGGMGQRANAQGLDLNRDFVKLESPEARALVAFLNEWDPHVVVDTHTTNGSLHRYALTYQGPQHPAGSPRVRDFVRGTMIPAIDEAFERSTGRRAFVYGNFEDGHAKWTGFPDGPRFGTNYVGLRHRISVLSEAYAYDSYADRVRSTREFVRACLDYAASHAGEIRSLLDRAREEAIDSARKGDGPGVAIRSEPRAFPDETVAFGYVEERREGRRTPIEPKDYRVEVVQDFRPTATVPWPHAYVVPAGFAAAIETLERHGVALERLAEETTLDVAAYRVESVERSARPFEGHPLVTIEVASPGRPEPRRIGAGAAVVRTAQPLGALAALLLEPGSADGLATWNFFDAGLEAGREFPVLRLEAAPARGVAAGPAAGPRADRKRITFETLLKGPRPDLNGSPASPRWIDDGHWVQETDGRPMRVEARTGEARPFHDPDALAKSLAELPTIGERAARSLARLSSFRLDMKHAALHGPRGGGPLLNPRRDGMVFGHEDDLYYASLDGKEARRLTSTPGEEEFAEFSPDGAYVAYVRDFDLYVLDLRTNTERRLTTGGSDLVRHGKADWVYFEEIFNRNWKAFWWSPDSSHIAFLECDDRPVGTHVVLNDVGTSGRVVEETRYPRAGEPNPRVRLGIVSAAGGGVVWADLSDYSPDSFVISGVGWLGGDAAYCYAQDRAQTWLDVVKVSARDGGTTRLLRETTGAWVENPGGIEPLSGGGFLFPSERTGWKHLYRYSADGSSCEALTSGDYEVRSVERVDEPGGWVYFTATKDDALAANLYRVRLAGGEVERLTEAAGDHEVRLSPDATLFLDTWSDPETPPKVALVEVGGERVRMVDENHVDALDEYELAPRERIQITTHDGFPLEAEILTPPDLDPSKVYPAWLMTYGGPHAPTIGGGWSAGNLMAQALASEGYVVFRVDPRSASGKGAKSARAAYRRLGVQELEDIKDAVAWLKRERPFVDGNRIGMAGHSYGGFLTAYCMTHSDLFAAGIAGAPVTDWRDYDSIYTERFMLTPQENPEGYDASSVVRAAKDLHGRLLLLHGAIDDNVSVRNTMRLVHALQQADKDFELMLYPSSRHGIFGPHYGRLQVEFIKRTLGGPRARGEREE